MEGILMKTKTLRAAAQRGFSLLTGFILAIIMFGTLAFFLAGQGINAGFGASYANTSKVSGMLASGGYISTGFDAVTLAGTSPASVTFDTTATTGIFNPTSGGAAVQPLDPTLFSRTNTTDGYWIYRGSDVKLQGVGVGANADYTMMVSGLKLAVCQQINYTLHGTTLATVPSALGIADATLFGAPTAAVPTVTSLAVDLTAVGVSGWANGCYSTSTGSNYVYIHTLLAQ
jgi:hypothetical protein